MIAIYSWDEMQKEANRGLGTINALHGLTGGKKENDEFLEEMMGLGKVINLDNADFLTNTVKDFENGTC